MSRNPIFHLLYPTGTLSSIVTEFSSVGQGWFGSNSPFGAIKANVPWSPRHLASCSNGAFIFRFFFGAAFYFQSFNRSALQRDTKKVRFFSAREKQDCDHWGARLEGVRERPKKGEAAAAAIYRKRKRKKKKTRSPGRVGVLGWVRWPTDPERGGGVG